MTFQNASLPKHGSTFRYLLQGKGRKIGLFQMFLIQVIDLF